MKAAAVTRPFPTFQTGAFNSSGISFSGAVLFLIGLSFIGSGFSATRVNIAGLLVHPYLLLVSIVFPLIAPTRINRVPLRVLFSLLFFASLYYMSTFAGGVAVGDGLKIGASVVTILTLMMLVERHHDYELGVLGLILAISLLGLRAIIGGIDVSRGVEVIQSSNRNTYSLYALGPILMAGQILLTRRISLVARAAYLGGILVSSLVIILSLNRSGWLGLACILIMLLRRNHLKAAVLIVVISGALLMLVSMFYKTNTIAERVTKSSGNESDQARIQLILYAFEIALENPLLGVSPQVLEYRLALFLGFADGSFATHNVYAYLAGGSGFLCLLALFWVGKNLWAWPPPHRPTAMQYTAFVEARRLLRMILILWLIRGFFTHEILYSPGFCASIGLTAGLCKAACRRG